MGQTTAASKLIRTSTLLVFAFTTSLSAAQLGLSTASVGPVHVFPGTNGTAQTIEAFNLGAGSLNLNASASTTWLGASIGAARACTTRSGSCLPVQISLNTTTLAAGTYTGYVTVADPNAIDSPQQITVTINVAGIPSSLNVYVTPLGGTLPSVYVPIYPQGASITGTAKTTSGGNWLQLVSNGLVGGAAPYGIQISSNSGTLPGSYTGSVAISGSNLADNKTVNVTMIVTGAPIIAPVTTPVQITGYAGGSKVTGGITLTNSGSGTLSVTGATPSSSANFTLTAQVVAGGGINLTADPGSLTAGIYSSSVTVASNASNSADISIPVVFTVEPAGIPVIYSGGVVNIGNFAADGGAPGDILAIFGDQLGAAGTFAQNPGLPPLATTLANVQVLVNNVPAPLYFVSAGQVNFQLPYEAPAGQTASVQVVWKGNAGNQRPVNVTASVPRLLIWPASLIAGGYGIVVNQDGSLVLPAGTNIGAFQAHPAKAGDTITIYCTGLGQTSPAAVTGAAATSAPLESISNVSVSFGGGFGGDFSTAAAAFAGLTPTAVGLYQVNVKLPAGVQTGALVPVTVSLGGVTSNVAFIAVSQ